MPQFMFRGVNANYHLFGSGRPLICLHSGGSSGRQWKRLSEALGDEYQLIAPDFLGFGETHMWPERGKLSHNLQADLVADIAVAEGKQAFDVVGHSYGGAAALRLILQHPHLVRSLVLIEPILNCLLQDAGDPLYPESISIAEKFIECARDERPGDAWRIFIDNANGPGTWDRMDDEGQARFLAQSAQAVEGFISNLNNPTTIDECRSIDVPTTVVCSTNTTNSFRRMSELVRDSISGVTYEVLEDAGHMSPLTRPSDIARIVKQHLASI
jgi:pimeloyl-ACP methyl ester carboxylesterase